MKLNAAFDKRAEVDTESMDWVESPASGVARKMLDRIGDEVARATSVVRYEAGSSFPEHEHGGGEEFLVLSGVFSDEHGDYGPGAYVRNPPGSAHSPFTRDGCVILVKLRQMQDSESGRVVVDTNAMDWQPDPAAEGAYRKPLFEDGRETVFLFKMDPGTDYPRHDHPGGEEIFVLEGEYTDDFGRHSEGVWTRNPVGSHHAFSSQNGCIMWVKIGHLQDL